MLTRFPSQRRRRGCCQNPERGGGCGAFRFNKAVIESVKILAVA